MRATQSSSTCDACGTSYSQLPVEYDEDGGYAIIRATPCTACQKLLCAACDQFHCDGCGKTHCADHMISVPDGTEQPLHLCPACWLESAEEYLLPVAEPVPPVCAEAQIECAACGSTRKTVQGEASHLGAEQPACCEGLRAAA